MTAWGQTTRFVSTTGTNTNPASATSWATSTTNLQGAINSLSATGGEVWVAAGTYRPTTGTDRTISFSMRNNVAIYGGFAGIETSLTGPTGRTLTNPSSTTLSGDIGTLGNNTDNSFHVFFNPLSLNSTAILDGVMITSGNANGANNDALGGGMFNSPLNNQIISNCLFIGNRAVTGGGMSNSQSSPTLTNCAFINNAATASGGGIANQAFSSPVVINCSFQGNIAPSGSGAAMINLNSSPSLTNCVVFGNGVANTFIGANSTLTANYCLFDAGVTGYSGSNNLTTSTSPFVSTTSVALNACTPAINAGDPSSATAATGPFSVTALPQTDLVGNPRIFGSRVDMGAVEFQSAPGTFTVAVTASPSFTITSGQTVTLTVSGGTSYTWTGGSTGSSFTATPASTATYSVTGVNASGCTSNTSVTVTVSAPPAPTITALAPTAGTACAGSVATFTATVGNVTGSYGFTLTNGSSPLSGTATGAAFSQTLTTAGAGGVQTFTLTIGANGNTTTASTTLNVGNHPDYAALVDLYNSTNGPGWTNQAGWLNGCDPCTGNAGNPWFGVTCTSGRVTRLFLFSNQLSGSIPNSLSALTSLQRLYLYNNQLSGSIPSSLSALTNLIQILLDNNQLSGSIPSSLSTLTNLQLLYLHSNQLSGSIPGSLSALTNLTQLRLFNNRLSGCYPASLSFMCGKTVSLQNNAGLPGGGSDASFSAFCASGAGSDGFVAVASASQTTATVGTAISLSSTGGSTATFSWLAPAGATLGSPATGSLVSATLTTPGEKTFTVTVSFGSSCSSAATVNVTGVAAPLAPTLTAFAPTTGTVCAGSVATFTATVGNVSGTYTFTLSNGSSPLSGTGTGTAFSQTLTTAGSGVQTFTLTIGANATTVAASTTLNIGSNPDYQALVDLYTNTGGNNWTNRTGWLNGCDPCTGNAGNPWFGVTCLGGRVTRLLLNNNQLSGSIPNSLSALTNLQDLRLFSNQLAGSIPQSLSALTRLTLLYLYNNQLSGNIPNSLSGLTSLQELALFNNQLSGSIPNSLSALTSLTLLRLENNQLSGSIPNSLSALTNLQRLFLDNNQLSGSIPSSLSALTNLQWLSLNNNQLTSSIPSSLSALTNLGWLFLNNNQLSGCYPASLSFMCGAGKTTNFNSNTGLPGGGSGASFAAFCTSGAGSDGFVAVASASQTTATVGTAISLSSTGGSTATFSWLAPAGATLGSPATGSLVSATLTTPGQKTFTVIVSFGSSCSSTATVRVTGVAAAPPVPTITAFAPAAGTVCAGSPATFTATLGNVTGTYNFTLTNGSSPLSGTATANPFSQTLTTAGSGVQTFTLTIGANGTTTAASTTLNMAPLPVAGISLPANLTLTCNTPTVALTATGGGTYRWDDNSTQAVRPINVSGEYSVTVTNGAGCKATASQNINLIVNNTPPTLVLSSTNVCAGNALSLSATAGLQSYTFVGANGVVGTGTASVLTLNELGAGVYSFTVLSTGSNSCTATATTSVTVLSRPAAPMLSAQSRLLTVSPTPVALTGFVVATGNALSFSGVTGQLEPPTANVSLIGVQNFSVVQTSASGCVGPVTPFSLTVVSSTIPPTTPASQTVCRGSHVVLSVVASGSRYEWYRGGQLPANRLVEVRGVQVGTSTASLTLVSVQTTGSYFCKVFAANGSFTWAGPFTVVVNANCLGRLAAIEPMAELTIDVSPNPLVDGQLRATVRGAGGQRLELRLTNLSNQPICQQQWEQADELQRVEWNLQSQPGGVYLLQAITDRRRSVVKVIQP